MKNIYIFFSLFFIIANVHASDINLALYCIVTQSSSADANHCGHLVVDGSLDTYWEANRRDKNQNLLIDLKSVREISQLDVSWGSNYALKYNVLAFVDNEDEGEVLFTSKAGLGGDQTINFQPVEARYIQINVLGVKDPIRGCVIKELAVLGEGPDHRFKSSELVQLSNNKLSLNGDSWRVQNAMHVNSDIKEIGKADFDDSHWIPARVPGTILSDYYNFGALPDPLYGDNMHQISDEFFSGNDFWYRTEIAFSEDFYGKRTFIDFSGINWKSDIYFNGNYLGRINGAFLRGEFEITSLIDFAGINTLTVLVHHNENWVSSTHKVIRKTLGARTTNGDMLGLDSPTCLAAAGWNWLPIVKGRNNGIWNKVSIRTCGRISIHDPWVSSTLNLPDTTKAELIISTELANHSIHDIEGKLVASFDNVEIEIPVQLLAKQKMTITLDKEHFSELVISNPKLWWPNGYGQQNLSKLHLKFIENEEVSDEKEIDFGIRHLEYEVKDNVLFVFCNGYRILLRGGNWGLPEAMMRLDADDYDLRVRLHKEANLNMIRNWLGMTFRDEFYEECDKYGILIFDDFWLANPADGPNPKDQKMFMANVHDKIKQVRKHPSLAIYCGRNEGLPPLALDVAMKDATRKLDGTRFYASNSAAGILTGFGPYNIRSPEWYFENRGNTFHTELGIIAIPEVESIRRMMPKEYLWPISNMWALHDYQWGRSEKYTQSIIDRYGEPKNLEDYSEKAQLLNYETGKAIMECLQSKQGGGTILWMSQSAWPSFICQLYDHYLEYTASYFAVKKAASPKHVFWDSYTNEIKVANNSISKLEDASLQAIIFDASGKRIWTKLLTQSIESTSVKSYFKLEHQAGEEVQYLKLVLSKDGQELSENFYWLENNEGNCVDLNDLPKAKVSMDIKELIKNGLFYAEIKLENQSSIISLLNKIKVKVKATGQSITPVFFEDDYVSILPGEERIIRMTVDHKYLKGKEIEIVLEGWNSETRSNTLFNLH